MPAPQKIPDKPLMPEHAWQPFTPRGVAAFAGATFTRVVLAQFFVSLLVGITLVWFLRLAWVPVIDQAIQKLPDSGVIRRGELHFHGTSPQRLGENSQLGIVVDLAATRDAGQVADVEITFEKRRAVFRGPMGAWWRPYDSNYIFSFNRPELEPGWGAWRWALLALLAVALMLSLFVMWWGLALVYLPLVKCIAFFADRAVTWLGAWRLSAAALLPGACLPGLGLLLYGWGVLHLFQLALFFALHFVVGWVFIFTSPFFLPKLLARQSKNPFSTAAAMEP